MRRTGACESNRLRILSADLKKPVYAHYCVHWLWCGSYRRAMNQNYETQSSPPFPRGRIKEGVGIKPHSHSFVPSLESRGEKINQHTSSNVRSSCAGSGGGGSRYIGNGTSLGGSGDCLCFRRTRHSSLILCNCTAHVSLSRRMRLSLVESGIAITISNTARCERVPLAIFASTSGRSLEVICLEHLPALYRSGGALSTVTVHKSLFKI